jgi:beta-lactam-binding protein with PASTA domain
VKRLSILPVLAGLMFGCGAAEGPVPDVVGERLDVAKSVMSDAGYDTESLGGGVVGIVDESNWTVCETRPAGGSTDGGTVKLIVDRTCDSAAAAVETVSGESPTAEAVSTPEVKKKPKSKPAGPRAKRIAVPDVTGMDHQLAQDTMQAAGLYMLDEEDASGQGRMLLYDRNWTVVRQSPRAGARVSERRTITLFSIKDE